MDELKIPPIDVEAIQNFLPHRYPFLMVDRILEIQPPEGVSLRPNPDRKSLIGTRVVGIKNISRNEWFFQGHFPGFAVFPGVLIAEAMAQVASFSFYPSVLDDPASFPKKFRFLLVGMDGLRFRRPVVPGDTLRIEAELAKLKGPVVVFKVNASVDGQKTAQGELIANMHPIGEG